MRLIFFGVLLIILKWLAVIYEWAFMEVLVRVLLALIVISIITGLSVLFGMKVEVDSSDERVVKGKRIPIIIDINNRSLLPVAVVKIKFITTNELYGMDSKCAMEIPVRKWGKQKFYVNMIAGSCGNIEIKVKSIKTKDMLGLIFIMKKIKDSYKIVIIPPYYGSSLEEQVDNKNVFMDSDTFSKDKPGDDPSEVFDIRQMQEGDSIKKINWKVSARKNEYMVNDYSLPIGKGTVIMLDTCINVNEKSLISTADAMFMKAMEISLFLSESEITHRIVWYNAKTKMCDERIIEPEDDVAEVFMKVYECGIYSGDTMLPAMYNVQYNSSQVSHVYYVGTDYNMPMIEELVSGKHNAIKKAYFSNINNSDNKEIDIEMLKAYDIEVLR